MDTPPLLTPDLIALLQRAVAEVATDVGFGTVAIIVEKGQPRRVQKTVDFLIRSGEHAPPGAGC